jgi:hypothetical protein
MRQVLAAAVRGRSDGGRSRWPARTTTLQLGQQDIACCAVIARRIGQGAHVVLAARTAATSSVVAATSPLRTRSKAFRNGG